jgi:hypothetical protein
MRTGAAHDSVTDIQYRRGAVLTYEDISATGWPQDQGRTLNPAAALPSVSHQFAELCLGLCSVASQCIFSSLVTKKMTYLYHINNATEFLEDFTEQDARH